MELVKGFVAFLGPYIYYLIPALILAPFFLSKFKRSSLPLPPGPKKYPLVGNLFQIPKSFEWEVYAQWSKDYKSDIIHLDAAGTSIVIVNSNKAAIELFEKRSAIYSDRAQTVMVQGLSGWDCLFAFMPYGEAWKERRKLFSQHFHPNNVQVHQPQEIEYTHKVIRRLLDSPEKFREHLRYLAGAITIALAYGIEVNETDDPYIQNAEKALIALSAAAAPGAFFVDSFPILKYVPSWMPGAGFKRKARMWKSWSTAMMVLPFEAARKAFAEGTVKQSFVSLCLAEMDEKTDVARQSKIIQDVAGQFFVGGADTTVGALHTFMLVMTCNPDIQRKAHEELDRVISPGNLPVHGDEPSMPYIAAIVHEVIRWNTVVPLAIPHSVTEDDEYNGYFIPKGSIVVGNAWAMTHDERDYPEPRKFNPERFLKNGKLDPDVLEPAAAFGFGRRVCPGKHIALSTLWFAVASILAVYDITPEIDRNGRPIMPTQEYISSLLLHPAPFKCRITPRSEDAKKLIQSLDTA